MLNETLEYPLPVLSVNVDEITMEAEGESTFTIKNTGGFVLKGKIVSPSRYISFQPTEWEGNRAEIHCRFMPDAKGLRPGDVLEDSFLILSNGGEIYIPITVKLAKTAITTPEGMTIANIQDFYEYAKVYPSQACRLFVEENFRTLPYINSHAYEVTAKQSDPSRALDNFFILSGLKKKTVLSVDNPHIEHVLKPGDNAKIHGRF